jgi:hypothetical protein
MYKVFEVTSTYNIGLINSMYNFSFKLFIRFKNYLITVLLPPKSDNP